MSFFDFFTWPNVRFILEGFLLTIEVAAYSIVFSFIIGLIFGTLRYTRIPVLSQVAGLLIDLIRNLPLLLIIFFIGVVLPVTGFDISLKWAAITGLSIFEGAMIAEIIRSGLKSVDKGQIEAARSSALNYSQTLWHIVMPQALRRMVPPIVSQFISLFKDTSLAVIITLPELTHNVQIVGGQQQSFVIPALIFAAFLYFVVNYTMSRIARRLEVRTH
ncbi:amino acid ABC transporter permease [Paenibacillus sp. JX-17]|uniref:Amino acid ABC transporter permease n=1 Tax=Paenibacillus lacisoli TaxID=3064525 RepID=A0ABT9CE17_9BACL|nr:amino acid ABC transporter permease [Paenibacillus sp. JX-17]MDO7906818.1 amino acid ABC transporter permease [Paenibacillus sp. JX-17]